jgi:hypothetical protein
VGYGAMAYTVDLDRLRAEIGSGDRDSAERYSATFTEHNQYLQDMIDDTIGDEGSVTVADVARHMILGEPCDERIGFAYGYFLKHLCETHGTFEDNYGWMPVPVDFPQRLDDYLAGQGLLAEGFTVTDLVFGGSPVPLPRIDDFPGIGYREFGTLTEPAEKLSWAGRIDMPEEFSQAVYETFQWLARADSNKRSVVVFFH